MFKIRASKMGKVVNLLSACEIYMTPMRFGKDGASINAMCPAHLRFAHVEIPKSCFDEVEMKDGVVAIDTLKMEKILKTSEVEEDVVVSFTGDPNYDTSHFKVGAGKKFSVRLDEYVDKKSKTPSFTFGATAEMDAKVLCDAVKGVSIFGGDVITIDSNENGIILSASDSNDNAEVAISKDEMAYEYVNDVKLFFALEYFKKIADQLSGKVTLGFVKDSPVTIVSKFDDIVVTVLIAPRYER